MVKLKITWILIPVLLSLFLLSCDSKDIQFENRAKRASQSQGDILIGVVTSSNTPNLFLEGVNMALEEINREGGVLGRQIVALNYDDKASLKQGKKIAKEISENPDVIAVVGHSYSGIAIPVSVTYEKHGILFLSPGATSRLFTLYGKGLTFRNIPSDEIMGERMADFCLSQGFKKMVIIYERESIGKMLSEFFYKRATDIGIEIVTRTSYFRWQTSFSGMISRIKKKHEFDAVFLAGLFEYAPKVIKDARNLGIKVPIITSANMDSPQLFTVAGDASEGVIVPTVFNPDYPSRKTREFVKKFESKFGVAPDVRAAQGYDAIRVLAYAIEEGYSTVPAAVASSLQIIDNWKGVTGSYSFTFNGDITGKSIFFKEVRKGKFEVVKFTDEHKKEKPDPFYVDEETTLRLPVEGIITTLDPGLIRDVTSIEIAEQFFLGLTDMDPETYEAVPELATHWTVSEDGRTYYFHLRENVIWTDGKSVTAHDIVWAIQRNLSASVNCPYVFMLNILKNAKAVQKGEKAPSEAGVKAIGDFTVMFELEHAASYFPAMAGLWVYRPLPRHIIEKYKNEWSEIKNIVTNGSYMPVEWQKGITMVLKKNPDYYDAGNVSIPEVHYNVIPESSLGLVMYEKNELDLMGGFYLRLPTAEIPRIENDPILSGEYLREPLFCTYAYGFNISMPPMNNPLLRKAISAAIDRELLIEFVTRGGEEPAKTYTRPPVFGSVDPKLNIGIQFDPVQAKKWLKQALEEEGYTGPESLPEIILLYNKSETHAKIARAVSASVKHYLNINIKLESKGWDDFVDAFSSADSPHHMFRAGWCGDLMDANAWLNVVFNPEKPIFNLGLKNPEFTELLEKAEKERNPEQRKKFYKRAEQILCEEEAAVAPIFFETAHYLVKPRIKGWYSMGMGGQHIRNWSFKK